MSTETIKLSMQRNYFLILNNSVSSIFFLKKEQPQNYKTSNFIEKP